MAEEEIQNAESLVYLGQSQKVSGELDSTGNKILIIHRTSSDEEKKSGKPKGLWCGQKILPFNECQSHTDSFITCPGCLKVIVIKHKSEQQLR